MASGPHLTMRCPNVADHSSTRHELEARRGRVAPAAATVGLLCGTQRLPSRPGGAALGEGWVLAEELGSSAQALRLEGHEDGRGVKGSFGFRPGLALPMATVAKQTCRVHQGITWALQNKNCS